MMGWYRSSRSIGAVFSRLSSTISSKTPTAKTIYSSSNTCVPKYKSFSLLNSTRNPYSVNGGVRHYCSDSYKNQFSYKFQKFYDYCHGRYGPRRILYCSLGVGSVGYGIVLTIRDGNWETIPYSKRTHLVLLSVNKEKEVGQMELKKQKEVFKERILSANHPDSVRVRSISKHIIQALRRELMIDQGKTNQLGYSNDNNELVNQQQTSAGKKKLMTKHLEGLKWEVLVVDKPTFNAFCLPGGKIVVYTGLLKRLKSDAEIATVIGHEVGHVVARHAAEHYAKYLWVSVTNMVLFCLAVLSGNAPADYSEVIINMSKYLLELPFSRSMEREADYIGLLLMASAGYDPRVAPSVYEMFDKIDGDPKKLADYTSTHPSGRKRAESLAKNKVMEEAVAKYQQIKKKS